MNFTEKLIMFGTNEALLLTHLAVSGAILLITARFGRAWLTAFIVVCTLLMNLAVQKSMTVFGMPITGGNVLFATVFLANDVLNEHFGRKAARQAVLIGFSSGLIVVVMMQIILRYAVNEYDLAQSHLEFLFDIRAYPRIVAASMVSYLLAQLLDVSMYQWIHAKTGTNHMLWLRSNASTWVSQAFDTVFFTTAGLVGTVIRSWDAWFSAILFAYVIKILLAALDTGFLYLTTLKPLLPSGSIRRVQRSSQPITFAD